MSKYIIKNCPAWQPHEIHYCYNSGNTMICPIHDDCILKQIVELCNDDLKPIREWKEGGTIFVEYKKDVHLAREILKLFDIQEVE